MALEQINWTNVTTAKKLELLSAALDERQVQLNNVFLLISAFCILFMQAGFLMFEAGSLRAKNGRSIMFKNVVDACVCGGTWFFIGYSVSTGTTDPSTNWINVDPSETTDWILSYAFAATACTIVSGGVAERLLLAPYMLFSMLMSAVIYPLAAFWAWHTDGFLARMGYVDFAGSGVVHMVGGASALVGAIVLGPRIGRFTRSGSRRLSGHSDVYVAIGTLILWFGWFFFNAVSSLAADPESLAASNRAAYNTLLASFGAGVVSVKVCVFHYHAQKVDFIGSAILAGLVGITAPCAFVSSFSAIVIGAVAVPIYIFADWALDKLRIDDPVNATPVHFACGMWGLLACGFFHEEEGLFTTGKTSLFVAQLAGIGVMAGWSGGIATVFFLAAKKLFKIRCNRDDELVGLDFKYCDGYNVQQMDAAMRQELAETEAAMTRKKHEVAIKKNHSYNSVAPIPE